MTCPKTQNLADREADEEQTAGRVEAESQVERHLVHHGPHRLETAPNCAVQPRQ